jgi:alanine-glyoxylate transaminase / serine-glyoxylate transaminase / serine-pyruvate transaminase
MLPRLMIPGPTDISDAALEQLGLPVRAHYGPDWTALHRDTIRLLREIIQTSGKIYMIAGSGSTANEVALNSALRPGEKVILGNNGMFGDRLAEMIASLMCEPIEVKTDPGVPLSPAAFGETLARHPDATLVAVVQLETSTGVLNPVHEIAGLARAAGVRVMVDAVSSLAGTDLPMDEWKIDIMTSGSQKCLGGPPGLAVVAVGDEGWKLVERPGARGWIMNLNLWQKYAVDWGDWHPHPATMPTNVVAAMHQSLVELCQEGLQNRLSRYWRTARRLRAGLRALGMPPVVDDQASAPVLTAAWVPDGVKSPDIVSYVIKTHNIQITAGFGALREKVVRIGHMATVTDALIDELLMAIEEYLDSHG